MKKDGEKYISPVGKFVYIKQVSGQAPVKIEVARGTVVHMTAHIVTIKDDDGHTQWVGWGPGMMMSEAWEACP